MSLQKLKAAILIISDTASRDPSSDRCQFILQQVFKEDGGDQWEVVGSKIIPDNVIDIQRAVTGWTDEDHLTVNLIVSSGGTGFAVKDSTPEAISPLLHKHASGLVHAMLAASFAITPFAAMSRPVAGVRRQTLILTLPGSPKGAKENLQSVLKLLPHACRQAAGADSRVMHIGGVKKLEKEAGLESVAGSSFYSQHDHNHDHHSHGHGGHNIPVAHTTSDPPVKSNDPSKGPSRRNRSSPYPMLSVHEALQLITSQIPPPQRITVPVNESLIGHVLASDATAVESVPAFRASIVDGYAVIVSDEAPSIRGTFPVAFACHAQAGEIPTLQKGQVARITTGAPLPPGATAVVMVEDTVLESMTADGKEEREVEILTNELKHGENVREAGSDVHAGDVVMRSGEGVSATGGEFGLLASVGIKEVRVYKKPTVGVMSTGDEIVPHDRPGGLKLGEVRDTNRPTLLAAVKDAGFNVVDLGIASDKPEALEAILRYALTQCSVLITSGGVSMGELDLLKPTIERSLGGTIHFGRVSMKPGKPTTFATVPSETFGGPSTGERGTRVEDAKKLVFSLPGNPASAVVTFMLFVLPALHCMSGITPAGLPIVKVRLESEVRCDAKREEYHRVVVFAKTGEEEGLWANSTGGQRSSRIGSFKGANALVRLPAGGGTLGKGENVDALLMGRLSGSGEL